MPRDPDRIAPFMVIIQDLWEEFPDQRFGQLIMNICRDEHNLLSFADPWEWEENEWRRRIEICRERMRGDPLA